MYSPYNPCCTGSFYGTGCTADCPSQQPVPRTTGDLGGFLDIAGGWQQFVPAIAPAAPDHVPPGRCAYCDGTGDVHSIDGEWRGVCTECDAGSALQAEIAGAIAWRAYSKAWPEAMSGPDPGRLVVASREAVGRMREVIAALDRNGWPLFAHSLHLPMTLLEKAASEAMSDLRVVSFCGGNQPVIKYMPPEPLDWSEA